MRGIRKIDGNVLSGNRITCTVHDEFDGFAVRIDNAFPRLGYVRVVRPNDIDPRVQKFVKISAPRFCYAEYVFRIAYVNAEYKRIAFVCAAQIGKAFF